MSRARTNLERSFDFILRHSVGGVEVSSEAVVSRGVLVLSLSLLYVSYLTM